MARKITKLKRILFDRGMTQTELYDLIEDAGHKPIGLDRLSRMISGTKTNYNVSTAKVIADTLGVTLDEIVD